MNTSTRLIARMAFPSAMSALAGCGDGGSKFVGTCDCGSGITLTILHISGNKYSMEGNHNGRPVFMPYKDGGLVDPGGKATIIEPIGHEAHQTELDADPRRKSEIAMNMLNQIGPPDGVAFGKTFSPGRPKQPRTLALRTCLASLAVALAASGGVIATPALAAGANPGAGPITLYGDVGNDFGSGEPFLRDASYFLVRPSTLLLAEDGSVDLENLRWSGWGTPVARATGVWSASDDMPSVANGKRTTSPVRLTLTSPGVVLGHHLYRCFRITFPHPPKPGMGGQQCLRLQGRYEGHDHYGYQ